MAFRATMNSADLGASIAATLADQRARTLDLIAPLDDHALTAQDSPLQSPIVWDLGHIANFEERWALDADRNRRMNGRVRLARLYDPDLHPRRVRGALELPTPMASRRYLDDVRARVESVLRDLRFDEADPLLRAGYVYAMIAQHEAQHSETILQTIALMQRCAFEPGWRRDPPPWAGHLDAAPVSVPAGSFVLGTDDLAMAYDNERPAHVVRLGSYVIDRAPVTNGEYLAFIAAGGYRRRELWTDDGWRWLASSGVGHPGQWVPVRAGWMERAFGRLVDLDPARPVVHVSWYEASAYARSVGKRLPTEAEWEKAAAWDDAAGRARRYPWGEADPDAGHANLDQQTFAPSPVGAFPAGSSPCGCQQMIGDVWEWTASEFGPYPGFGAFPYEEYSQSHFGRGYRVLRGGSWATRSIVARATFRNWDLPERRQIFAGFRCAADA
jgi:iron(II)-dependent oxidoreductase